MDSRIRPKSKSEDRQGSKDKGVARGLVLPTAIQPVMMTGRMTKSQAKAAAAALGRRGGSVRSEAKTASGRINAAKALAARLRKINERKNAVESAISENY